MEHRRRGRRCIASSLAQRQMVEIAKALATRRGGVRMLVMDEPTSALTSREVDQLFALIERLTRAVSPSSTSRTGSTRSIASASA